MKKVLIISGGLFILLTILLFCQFFDAIDPAIYGVFAPFIGPVLTNIMLAITTLGDPFFVMMIGLFIFYYLWKGKEKKQGLFFLLISFLALLAMVLGKLWIARERPDILPILILKDYSFPSGHSIFAALFYGYLAFFIHRDGRGSWKIVGFVICFLLFLAIGISRIYLGVHYFSDVLAGYCIGIFFLSCLLLYHKKWDCKR